MLDSVILAGREGRHNLFIRQTYGKISPLLDQRELFLRSVVQRVMRNYPSINLAWPVLMLCASVAVAKPNEDGYERIPLVNHADLV
jgi:hypothetical protein